LLSQFYHSSNNSTPQQALDQDSYRHAIDLLWIWIAHHKFYVISYQLINVFIGIFASETPEKIAEYIVG
jgi:hypothetical protein